jgi:hypothetical protein
MTSVLNLIVNSSAKLPIDLSKLLHHLENVQAVALACPGKIKKSKESDKNHSINNNTNLMLNCEERFILRYKAIISISLGLKKNKKNTIPMTFLDENLLQMMAQLNRPQWEVSKISVSNSENRKVIPNLTLDFFDIELIDGITQIIAITGTEMSLFVNSQVLSLIRSPIARLKLIGIEILFLLTDIVKKEYSAILPNTLSVLSQLSIDKHEPLVYTRYRDLLKKIHDK